jgi:hypothetical protein
MRVSSSCWLGRRDDLVAVSLEHGLEQADVLSDVVDHEDACCVVAHRLALSQ